jgi:hypothetical protein
MVGTKVREPPTFYGQNNLEELLRKFEVEVLENQIFLALDISLKPTLSHWWGTHKENINN